MQIINKSSLANFYHQVKLYPDIPKDVFVFLVVVLVAFGAFSIGRSSVLDTKRAGELKILDVPIEQVLAGQAAISTDSANSEPTFITRNNVEAAAGFAPGSSGMYVGAKSGRTYYLPWCSGVKRIKEENKTWFATRAEAEATGYKPAANCVGI